MAATENEFVTAFFLMSQVGEKVAFREALKKNPHWVKIRNELGMTLLHYAVGNRDIESIKILIENDAEPSSMDEIHKKQSALHYAAAQSYFFAIYLTLLIKDITKKDFTELCIQALEFTKIPASVLLFLKNVFQLTFKKFDRILKQVLEEADPKYFSSAFKTALLHRQTLASPTIKDTRTLVEILVHTNESMEFTLLFFQLLDKTYSKSSNVLTSPPIIHPSSPIYSPPKGLKRTNSDISDLEDDSLDSYNIVQDRRNSFP